LIWKFGEQIKGFIDKYFNWLAIGFTVGAAFSAVARSLVEDIIMPPVGLFLGESDFSNLYWVLKSGTPLPPYDTLALASQAGAVTVNYGIFINNLLSLLVVALSMFLVIRAVNKMDDGLENIIEKVAKNKTKPKISEPEVKKCPFCYSTINFKAKRCPECTSHLDKSAK